MSTLSEGKHCSKCGSWKPFTAFRKRKDRKDALTSQCKDCMNAQDRVYRANLTPEQRDHLNQRRRDYHVKRPDVSRNASRRWFRRQMQANPEAYRIRKRAWRRQNAHKLRGRDRRRWLIEHHAPGHHTKDEWRALRAWFGERCLACGATDGLTKDHVVSLLRGGSKDISNIQPLCGPCNSRKRDESIDYSDPDQLQAFLASLA